MILLAVLLTLFSGGALALLLGTWFERFPKIIATFSLLTCLLGFAILYQEPEPWLVAFKTPWIQAFNINFHLALSGLSFWLCVLALVVSLLAISISKSSKGSYYAAVCWSIMALLGIFLAADIFLFFIFWEIALFPIYFLLSAQGNEASHPSLIRYIIYTQASGLILLLSIVGLAFAHLQMSGILTFDYHTLTQGHLPLHIQRYLLCGFALAFMIKLPIFPLHSWLPSIFMSAPVPVILVGVLIKTALFGLIQFSWPLFPEASKELSVVFMTIGLISMLYGALLAFSQNEPKKVIAYSTLSHVGFMLMGVFSHSKAAYLGVSLLMCATALSGAGILMLLDLLYKDRSSMPIHTVSGLWSLAPRYSSVLLIVLLASLGAPMFGNFMGEWLVLWGVFNDSIIMAVFASLGIIFSAIYCLWLFQRLAFSTESKDAQQAMPHDLTWSQLCAYGFIVLTLLFLGLHPKDIVSAIASSAPSTTQLSTLNRRPI